MGCAWLARLCSCGTVTGHAAVTTQKVVEASDVPVDEHLRKADVRPEAIVGEDGPCRQSSSLQSKLKVPFTELTFHALIGKGSFKQVYRGKWNNTIVAIVAMRRGGLVAEARLMQQLGAHPNLLQFYRWSTDTRGNEFMVMELMPFGSLDKILTQIGPSLRNRSKLMMCEQICNAMCELAAVGMQHRDLAARNILVQSLDPIHVKVSDFGLARVAKRQQQLSLQDPKPRDGTCGGCSAPGGGTHHTAGGESSGNEDMAVEGVEEEEAPLVPVRWSAPEVLQPGGGWSEKSDVYSYGITMWEIFSNGAEPYASRSDLEAAAAIVAGDLLRRPINCPHQVYAFMLNCWRLDPAQRPSFRQIADVYRRWREATLAARASASGAKISTVANKTTTATTATTATTIKTTVTAAGVSDRSCTNSILNKVRAADTAVGRRLHSCSQVTDRPIECPFAPMPLSASPVQLSLVKPPSPIATAAQPDRDHARLATLLREHVIKSAAMERVPKHLAAIPSGEVLREVRLFTGPLPQPAHESKRRVLSPPLFSSPALEVNAETEMHVTLGYPPTASKWKVDSDKANALVLRCNDEVDRAGALLMPQHAAADTSPNDSASSEATTTMRGDSGSIGERAGAGGGCQPLAGLVAAGVPAIASEAVSAGDGASPAEAPVLCAQENACADGAVVSSEEHHVELSPSESVAPHQQGRQLGSRRRRAESLGGVRSGRAEGAVGRSVWLRGVAGRPGVRRCSTIAVMGRSRLAAPSPTRPVLCAGVSRATPGPAARVRTSTGAVMASANSDNKAVIPSAIAGARVRDTCESVTQMGLARAGAHAPPHSVGAPLAQTANSGGYSAARGGDRSSCLGVRAGINMHRLVSDYPSASQHCDGSGSYREATTIAAPVGCVGFGASASGGGLSTLAGVCDTCLLSMEVETAIDPMLSGSTGQSLGGTLRNIMREGLVPPGQQVAPFSSKPAGSVGRPGARARTASGVERWQPVATNETGARSRCCACRASCPCPVHASPSPTLPLDSGLPQTVPGATPLASSAIPNQGALNEYLALPLHCKMATTGTCATTFQSITTQQPPPPTLATYGHDEHGHGDEAATAAASTFNTRNVDGVAAVVNAAPTAVPVAPFHGKHLTSALAVEQPPPSGSHLPLPAAAATKVVCSAPSHKSHNPYLFIKELYC